MSPPAFTLTPAHVFAVMPESWSTAAYLGSRVVVVYLPPCDLAPSVSPNRQAECAIRDAMPGVLRDMERDGVIERDSMRTEGPNMWRRRAGGSP